MFAAGADVKEFAGQDHAQMMRDADRLSSSLAALAALPVPVIAAVTGYALGGGCELALTADFRVSADNARWGQPEILLGIIPGAGGTQRLPRLIGPAKAKDLIFSGRFVDADEALEIGLVDVVVPAAEVYPAALALAAKFAKRSGAGAGRGQGRDRRRARRRAERRPAPGVAPVRVAVRHRGPHDRHALVHRVRARQGHLHRDAGP